MFTFFDILILEKTNKTNIKVLTCYFKDKKITKLKRKALYILYIYDIMY